MRATIEKTRHLTEQLASSAVISASRCDVSRLMGHLFLDKYRYHLSRDLSSHHFSGTMNNIYQCLVASNAISKFVNVDLLNERVEVVLELCTLLGDEIATQNSTALEFAITIMIGFEILLKLVTLAKEKMRSVYWGFSLFFALMMLTWVLWRLYRRSRFSSRALERQSLFFFF